MSPGAGYVESVGAGVDVARPGDPVLLSFACCRECEKCLSEQSAWCAEFSPRNAGAAGVFTQDGNDVRGLFFGQSSFAQRAIVHESSVVNIRGLVTNSEQLHQLAPMGCGFLTGSATVSVVAEAKMSDQVVIIGLGAVGMTSLMVWTTSPDP